jgi:hypothetical protein
MKKKTNKAPALEGEGSYSATRRYNAGVAKSVAAGKSDAQARNRRIAHWDC